MIWSGGENSRSGGEHSPVRAHTSTRLRSWACRNHETLTNLWRSKGLWRWVFLSNARTFSLQSPLWLGLGASACVEGMLPACFSVCDTSDKRRKSQRRVSLTKRRHTEERLWRQMAVMLRTNLVSFRSCKIVHVTADAAKRLFTWNRPCTYRKCQAALKQWTPFQHRSSTRPYLALNGPVPPRNAEKSVLISIIITRKSPWGRLRTAQ